ncbi:ABC transporter substrate-binding protein [Brevibacterium sp.]|uniref:ABC transporter substrate-binding protein n=1 Tax=Brevibacterium sp. TaxID=1701 RepID=UPI0028115D25|nr:ABC transporter substrate-binding protein [Brevibacterium sp.]
MRTHVILAVWLAAVVGLASACTPAAEAHGGLRLGYFANLTHAPALIGLEQGLYSDELDGPVSEQRFTAGPAAIEALSAGAVDAAYIGAAPIANSYVRSEGRSAVVVAGATNGGAGLVVDPGRAEDLEAGRTALRDLRFATPGLGNTQDVALRSWLADQRLEPSLTGHGDVSIAPMSNSQIFTLFTTGSIDAAWLAEPWASRLVVDGGGTQLLDEAELWPGGTHPSAVLAVNQDFLREQPEQVAALLRAHLTAIDFIHTQPEAAADTANHKLETDTGAALSAEVLSRAWKNLDFDADIPTAGLEAYHHQAVRTRLQPEGSLAGLTVTAPLDQVRSTQREGQ